MVLDMVIGGSWWWCKVDEVAYESHSNRLLQSIDGQSVLGGALWSLECASWLECAPSLIGHSDIILSILIALLLSFSILCVFYEKVHVDW